MSSTQLMEPLQPLRYQDGYPPEAASTDLEEIIKTSILNQPRSLQKRIGPSEIGNPCDHCLAAKLAGWEKTEVGIPWATTVGTAVHALLEKYVLAYQTDDWMQPEPSPRYYTEATVTVGSLAGQPITGSIDVLDTQAGMTVDYKVVGKTSLQKYRREGPSPTYRVQAHLYAMGANKAGFPTKWVSIWFLPKAGVSLSEGFWWREQYMPEVAAQALARLEHINSQLTALESAGGSQLRDKWITSLPRADGCWDCKKYSDRPKPQIDSLFNLNPGSAKAGLI